MAQWSGTLLSFSGVTVNAVSGLSIGAATGMPLDPINIAIYGASFSGGFSGTAAVNIFAYVGGITLQIAGRTAMNTATAFQVWNTLSGSSAYPYGLRPSLVEVKGTSAGATSWSVVVSGAMVGVGN